MSEVLSEISDGVMTITLNRPEAGNSLNEAVGRALVDAFAAAEANEAVRVVVITGTGEKVFCAGLDLKAFAAGADMMVIGAGLDAIGKCPKPVIAAVNGAALAGGFEVALKADLIVAAEHARFGIPEVKRGLFAAGGGTRLPARIPLQMALELGLTGDPIGAQRAYDLGVVNRVVPAAELLSAARALAATIAANGPLAVRATKELMWGEIGESDTAAHGQWAARVFASDDAREGAIAFAEKRAPAWKGR
jgi:enoyl-CoA hydratase/carnithine racemase